jgi:hypothetical protein
VAVEAEGCLLDEAPEPGLGEFVDGASAGEPDLRLTVRAGALPPSPPGPPLFTTQAWQLWTLPGGGYQVSLLRAPGAGRPVLVSDHRTGEVTFHAAPGEVREAAGLPLVFDPFRMPVDQLLLAQHLAFREGFILHAAGFAVGEVGFVVPGVSGAGKSTLTALLGRSLPDATVLSDERIIVRAHQGQFEAWGTPWFGTARVARNRGAPLRALVFIEQHPDHGMAAISPSQAVRRLFGVMACPLYDAERAGQVLRTVERMVAAVPAFVLRFARDPGVGAVVLDFLRAELGAA